MRTNKEGEFPGENPYIIAEISGNHNNSLDNAIKLIDIAKECGANAVKLQTYTAECMVHKANKKRFIIKEGLWKGRSLYDLYEEAALPWEWHEKLFERAREVDIEIFSSPFSKSAVDLLENLGVNKFKIASFEVTDLDLIEYVASKNKTIIASTGIAEEKEIRRMVQTIRNLDTELILLHCISDYPSKAEEYNMTKIKDMQNMYKLDVGLSDHTQSSIAAIIGIALGSRVFEKHLTLNNNNGGTDDEFSTNPNDFSKYVKDINQAWKSISKPEFNNKIKNREYRRTLFFKQGIEKGEIVTEKDLGCYRPGIGMDSYKKKEIIGRIVSRKVEAGEPVTEQSLL